MKTISKIVNILIALLVIGACTDELRDLSFVNSIQPPSNVSATYDITQNNTGVVTITPTADGASSFEIYFGDNTAQPAKVTAGKSITHTYTEGTYEVRIVAFNTNGVKTEAKQQLVVSFKAPKNLVVVIENDKTVSKKVNITATADYATMFDFYTGEPGNTTPISGNIGATISHTYATAGKYTIKVVAKGAAIATTEYTKEFEVTAILQPIAAAPTPPNRNPNDVIAVYGSAYTNIPGTDTFPDWGQGGQGSSWAEFDLNGDKMLQYVKLSYQGIQLGASQDLSNMEYLHLDVWTADVDKLETSLINVSGGVTTEKPVTKDLTKDSWTSIEIPISDYTAQGLTVSEILQLKFVGTPWATGTVFIDNIYFYKSPSNTSSLKVEDFEGAAPTFTHFGNIAPVEVVANPDATGKNTTGKVAKMVKTNGAETWAGAFFETTSPLNLTNYKKISVKTWSPKAGAQVKLKLENHDASVTYEADLNTTVANQWEELIYDFSAAPVADYVKVVIFFDFGKKGDDSIYYYDEVNLVNDAGNTAKIFQDFEGTAPTFTTFGNIADTEVVANPNMGGMNTTAKVAKLTKTNGAETWAGTFFELSSPLDLANYKKIKVKTWSPKAGIQVKLKLENHDASVTHEVDLNTTVANQWEELVYDFSNAPVGDYVKVVIFFDFGKKGDDTIYYFDEYALTN